MAKLKPKPKARKPEFKRTRLNFDEMKELLSSIDYIKIASFLWQIDTFNPAIYEIYNAVEHSHIPKPNISKMSILCKYQIIESYYKIQAKKKKAAENKRKEDAKKKARK